MTYSDIISKVAINTGISPDIVEKTYKYFWRYIKESIEELPLKEDLDSKSFDKLRTNFNIPSLGKLTCTYDKYLGVKKRFNYISELRKKNEKAQ